MFSTDYFAISPLYVPCPVYEKERLSTFCRICYNQTIIAVRQGNVALKGKIWGKV